MGARSMQSVFPSPAMPGAGGIQAAPSRSLIRTQSADCSFAYEPNSYDLIVSEFARIIVPDFLQAVRCRDFCALSQAALLFARYRVRQHSLRPGSRCRAMGDFKHQEPRLSQHSVVTLS